MKRSAVPPLYLAQMIALTGHVFEEVWGRFRPIEHGLGLGGFLIINWIILAAAAVVFVLILGKNRPAYALGAVFAAGTALNGFYHIVALALTGRYFGGFAGGFTGLPMLVVGILLLRALLQERWTIIPRRQSA